MIYGLNPARDKLISSDKYTVGHWTVEPKLNKLSKTNGESEIHEVVLVPKVMTLLQCLSENPGQPVHQDELMEKIWPGRIVSDSSIYQAIAQLRKALEDTGTKKQYIERVSGKGYRLIAPTSKNLQQSTPIIEKSLTPQENISSRRKSYKINSLIGVFIVLLITAITYFIFYQNEIAIPTQKTVQPSIDKLTSISLKTLNTETVIDKHLLSLDDVILSQLSSIDNMKVVSLKASNEVSNTDALLKGKIHQQDNQVRVVLQLESNKNGEVIWAKLFEGDISDLFSLQDKIINSLLVLFERSQSSELFVEQYVEKHNFEQYLLARHFWEKRNTTDLEKAQQIYENMKKQGSLFPLAAVGLCNTYHFLYIYSDWTLDNALQKCAPLLDEALRKQPKLGQALAAKAFLLSKTSQAHKSEALFKKSIELAPNYAFSYMWYGSYISNLGRVDEAFTLTNKAYKLAPMSPIVNRNLAISYLNQHNLPEAAYYYQRALNLEPNYTNRAVDELEFLPISVTRANAFYTWLERNKGALAKNVSLKLQHVQVAIALGNLTQASELLQSINQQKVNSAFLLYVQASNYASLGNLNVSNQLLEQRREANTASLKLALPHIYSLYELNNYQLSYQELVKVAPFLEQPKVIITSQNQFIVSFYLQLLQKVNKDNFELYNNLNQWFMNEKNKDKVVNSIGYAEWLLFLDNKQQVQVLIQSMMNDGWLPDTNIDPFIEVKMKRLFIESGLGESLFKEMLLNNRQKVIAVI